MFTLLFLNTNFRDLMINNKINPIVNQFEITPFYQQHFAHDYMTTKGILTESWAPFAEGEKGLFQNPTLVEIANKYQHSVAQVVLCWLIQRGIIVIPKLVNPDRVEENFKVFDFELSTKDMKTIHSLDTVQSQFFSYHDPDQVERNSGLKLKD